MSDADPLPTITAASPGRIPFAASARTSPATSCWIAAAIATPSRTFGILCSKVHRIALRLGTGLARFRAEPELLCPVELRAGSPLPDGRVDLRSTVSRYINSGSAIPSETKQSRHWLTPHFPSKCDLPHIQQCTGRLYRQRHEECSRPRLWKPLAAALWRGFDECFQGCTASFPVCRAIRPVRLWQSFPPSLSGFLGWGATTLCPKALGSMGTIAGPPSAK